MKWRIPNGSIAVIPWRLPNPVFRGRVVGMNCTCVGSLPGRNRAYPVKAGQAESRRGNAPRISRITRMWDGESQGWITVGTTLGVKLGQGDAEWAEKRMEGLEDLEMERVEILRASCRVKASQGQSSLVKPSQTKDEVVGWLVLPASWLRIGGCVKGVSGTECPAFARKLWRTGNPSLPEVGRLS